MPLWRLQCPTGKAVFTVPPHCVLRYRQRRPDVARNALLAPHGGLRLERCAGSCPLAPLAISRLVWAFGPQRLGAVLTRGGLPLPGSFVADEKPRHCLAAKVSLSTMIRGRALWHLADTENARAAAGTQSYGELPRAGFPQAPAYRVRGILTVTRSTTKFSGMWELLQSKCDTSACTPRYPRSVSDNAACLGQT